MHKTGSRKRNRVGVNFKLLIMKNKFEVVISPTDVLGEELKNVLGGTSGEGCVKCKRTECNCQAKGQPAITPADCPPGYTVINNVCIELD